VLQANANPQSERKADHRAELTEAVSGSWSACRFQKATKFRNRVEMLERSGSRPCQSQSVPLDCEGPRQRPLKSIIAGKMNRISPIFPTLYAPLSQSAMALLSVMLIFIESVGRSARALAKVS
jgi:hypothetical protein